LYREINIQDLIGVPYKHRGRDYRSGLDCWGLVVTIYKRLGLAIRDLEDYEQEGDKKGYDYFTPKEEWIKKSFPSPYDVVLFVNSAGIAFHAGVITNELKMIHSSKHTGVVIVPLNMAARSLIIEGFYKLKVGNGSN
jgi:cell wall-associated NlpC family hydrolase